MTVATRPTIPPARYRERLERAARATADAGFDALLVGVGPDLRYLTGYEALPLERLTMLVIVPGDDADPARRPAAGGAGRAGGLPDRRPDRDVGGDRRSARPRRRRSSTTARAPGRCGSASRIGSGRFTSSGSSEALPGASFESATVALRELRMTKDPDEIALLRLAAQAADRVVAQIAAGRLVGRTEADVAREVRERLLAEGHEEALFAIVGSGPNSASPHHEASERVIQAGEPIVLDIGGTLGGYGSDITRTLWVTGGDAAKGPDEEFRHLFGVLHAAQEKATRAVRPGVACEAIDAAARDAHRRRGLRRGVLPPDRPRDRARGPRGPVPRRRQHGAARRGHGVQRRAGHLPDGPVRRPDRGHRRVRAGRPDRAQRGAARALRRRRLTRLGYHPRNGEPGPVRRIRHRITMHSTLTRRSVAAPTHPGARPGRPGR